MIYIPRDIHLVDNFDASGNVFLSITKNETVEIFLGMVWISIRWSVSFPHGAYPSNTDFGLTFALIILQFDSIEVVRGRNNQLGLRVQGDVVSLALW